MLEFELLALVQVGCIKWFFKFACYGVPVWGRVCLECYGVSGKVCIWGMHEADCNKCNIFDHLRSLL
jgi:hypothetical protein